jgi:hypothetical protein
VTTIPISPGRLAVAIALFFGSGLGSVAVAALFMFYSFSSMVRIEAPGTRTIPLKKGPYTVYWESAAMHAEGARAPTVQVRVVPKDVGPPVNLEPVGKVVTRYSTFNTAGASIFEFSIERPGDYEVSVTAPPETQPAPGRISMAKSIGLAGVLLMMATLVLPSIAGAIAAIVVVLKRPKAPATPA